MGLISRGLVELDKQWDQPHTTSPPILRKKIEMFSLKRIRQRICWAEEHQEIKAQNVSKKKKRVNKWKLTHWMLILIPQYFDILIRRDFFNKSGQLRRKDLETDIRDSPMKWPTQITPEWGEAQSLTSPALHTELPFNFVASYSYIPIDGNITNIWRRILIRKKRPNQQSSKYTTTWKKIM